MDNTHKILRFLSAKEEEKEEQENYLRSLMKIYFEPIVIIPVLISCLLYSLIRLDWCNLLIIKIIPQEGLEIVKDQNNYTVIKAVLFLYIKMMYNFMGFALPIILADISLFKKNKYKIIKFLRIWIEILILYMAILLTLTNEIFLK